MNQNQSSFDAEAHNYLGNYDEAIKDYLQYIRLTKGIEKEAPHYIRWLYHRQEIIIGLLNRSIKR